MSASETLHKKFHAAKKSGRKLARPLSRPIAKYLPIATLAGEDITVLELDLGRGVIEGAPATPLAALQSINTPTLRTLVEHLRKAAQDDSVRGLIATIDGDTLNMTQSTELAAAVREFRAAEKATFAWSASFGELSEGNPGYHLAAAFEEVWLQPSGSVGLVGFATRATFVRGTLDKLGVEPQIHQRMEYKSAAETFMRHDISPANTEMLSRISESATDTLIADVALDRSLTRQQVQTIVEGGPLNAQAAAATGLVDRLGYRDEVYAAMRARVGTDEPELAYVERYGVSKFEELLDVLPKGPGSKPVIALVNASGPIVTGRGNTSPLARSGAVGADTLCATLRAAGRDAQVKAVVLRIDSPGGSYIASDMIRREIQVLREAGKPVIASMASVAASGGYFIAMPAARIFALPTTLTGSIGVLAGKQVIRGGLEKIGVSTATLPAAPFANMLSATEPFTDAQLTMLDQWLDEVYADFTDKAAADREMPVKELRKVAKGRVWTGADALERGLVDQLGGLEEAIAAACEAIDTDRDKVTVRSVPKLGPFAAFMPAENSESLEATVRPISLEGPPVWQQLAASLGLSWNRPLGVLSMPPLHVPGLIRAGL